MSELFLNPKDVIQLTDKKKKSAQIAALRQMGIRFLINPSGRPVVPKSSIDGRKAEPVDKTWSPAVLK